MAEEIKRARAATGVRGLDEILGGGLPAGEIYLLQGRPGTGKTTLGLQFLLEGSANDENILFVTLAQTQEALQSMALSHGWAIDDEQVFELSLLDVQEGPDSTQTLFHTTDVELIEMTESIIREVQERKPRRMVFDSLAVVRLIANNPVRFRRQILRLRRLLVQEHVTSLFLDDMPGQTTSQELENIAHGVISLVAATPGYGNTRRRLRIIKIRDIPYREGFHNYRILTGGFEVYPRLNTDGPGHSEWRPVESGVAGLDAMLGGGLREGSSCLITGTTGTGKTSLALLYANAVARRGERSEIFLFDERRETVLLRSDQLDMNIREFVDEGLIGLRQISTGEVSPGAFAQQVRRAVEDQGVKLVIIDSLTGYVNAMLQEELLITQMHELLMYLSQHGVLSLLLLTQEGLLQGDAEEPINVSYIADSLILLRHIETEGELRQAISVIKSRNGVHEHTVRELRINADGLNVGAPLKVTGVLSKSPALVGENHEDEP